MTKTCRQEGREAFAVGKSLSDNPYVVGFTKLGSPKLSEDGIEWEQGYASVGRAASRHEIEAAATVNVSQFGKRAR